MTKTVIDFGSYVCGIKKAFVFCQSPGHHHVRAQNANVTVTVYPKVKFNLINREQYIMSYDVFTDQMPV